MACQFYGPYDPQHDPKDTLEKWVKTCPTMSANFPRACLLREGVYALYCCSEASDYPCATAESRVSISLTPDQVRKLSTRGKLGIDGGTIRVAQRDSGSRA